MKSIFFPDGRSWSATFGIFEWVLEFTATRISDRETIERLQLIVDVRLTALVLDALSADGRSQVVTVLRDDLPTAVDTELVLDLPESDQQSMRAHIKQLAVLASQQHTDDLHDTSRLA